MQAAAKLGISITISQVGSDLPSTGTPATASPIGRTKDWQPAFTLDEDGILHQLRATLVQAIDASMCKLLEHALLIHFIFTFAEEIWFADLYLTFHVLPYAAKLPLANLQQSPQQNPLVPNMQECIDAITEHQRLHALMKGEWVKGLLPQSSVRADYTVQRIRGT